MARFIIISSIAVSASDGHEWLSLPSLRTSHQALWDRPLLLLHALDYPVNGATAQAKPNGERLNVRPQLSIQPEDILVPLSLSRSSPTFWFIVNAPRQRAPQARRRNRAPNIRVVGALGQAVN